MTAPIRRILIACALAASALAWAPGTGAAAVPEPPMVLPGDEGARTASKSGGSSAPAGDWIVGGLPGEKTAAVAAGAGAREVIPSAGVYSVPAARARELAATLEARGLLVYAEPDVEATREAFPTTDPKVPDETWLPFIINTGALTPPSVGSGSPLLGVMELSVDAGHSDLSSGDQIQGPSFGPLADDHGTGVVGVAVTPSNGIGIVGVWPGGRATVFSSDASCESVSGAVIEAARAGAAVINMSYEFRAEECYTHFVATQAATAAGAVLVAAAGNERLNGNYAVRPASDPHVLAVAATDGVTPAEFSNEGTATDVSAPGVNVLTTTSLFPNAHAYVAGTSYSAPMVAAAALWIRAERPGLTADQIADVIRDSAVDIFSGGWDTRTGFGMLNVQRALAQQERTPDQLEPNDDIAWVDGSIIGPAPAVYSKSKKKTNLTPLAARLDVFKDQVDVYRARLRPKSRFTAKLRASSGNPDLELWSARAGTVLRGNRGLVDFSRKKGKAGADTVTVRNKGKKRRKVFVVAYIDATSKTRTADYVLKLK
jgi:hypothetical protein